MESYTEQRLCCTIWHANPKQRQGLDESVMVQRIVVTRTKHGEKISSIHSIPLSKICQEKLEIGNILHFFNDNGRSCIEKLG